MKKTIILGLITIFFVAFLAQYKVYSQTKDIGVKFAVVDIETILKEMPEAIEADKKLKEIGTKWQDTLISMKKDFDERIQKYQKQKSLMNAEQQNKEEEALQNSQMQIMQYQDQKFGTNGELNQMREKFLEPIRIKVRNAIQKVAKEEKFSLVLDKGNPVVLYFEDKYDITYKVLDVIKRGQ